MQNVAIIGYGNLGKALEQNLTGRKDFNLVGVFSRRNIDGTIPITQLNKYKDIDILFVCSGSKTDLESQAQTYIKDYNLIESYDNHNRLKEHLTKMNTLSKKHKTISLCSIGWDPGLFSYMRGLFDTLGYAPFTFWGKGVSQGHTQAIKSIDGVIDAVQFTIPLKEEIQKVKSGKQPNINRHKRVCYVVSKTKNKESIKRQIVNMEDYFKGQEVKVYFVSQKKLDELKTSAHQGTVLTQDNTLNFSLKLKSNPHFTASIMIAYAKAISYLKDKKLYGAYTIFDLPLNIILPQEKYKYL